jgi:hypothetical protein
MSRAVGHLVHIYQYAKAFETGIEFEEAFTQNLSKVKNLLLFLALCALFKLKALLKNFVFS